MSEKVKEILNDLKKTADNCVFMVFRSQEELDQMPRYTSNFMSINDRQAKILLKYIEDLQQKVEQLEKENIKQKEIIENLTTMTVCGDKKQIKNTAQYKLEQLENIRKEQEKELESWKKKYGEI